MSIQCCVIGSGPAGVSAALSLLRQGHSVTMVDVGCRLEPERQELVNTLAASRPEVWDERDLARLREATKASVGGLPQKLVYGSDYPYRAPAAFVQIEQRGTDLLVSHGLGGLSTAWGANVLPFHDEDLTDWPICSKDLAYYYGKVFEFINLSAREDRLASRLPLYTSRFEPLQPSRQAQTVLLDLERHYDLLTRQGVVFGQSRLAVRTAGCVYCGLCLYGCPYGLINSSAQMLPELRRFPQFQYAPGYYVERLAETPSTVTLHARRVANGQSEQFKADRVFVGAGTVSTTKIIVESLAAFGREILVRDSQYFLTPLLRGHGTFGITTERLHTLSQIALELDDRAVSTHAVHLLLYTYNDLYRRALARICPVHSIQNWLLSRLLILQGYLHSTDSPSIALCVERPGRVVLEARPNPRTRLVIRRVLRRLRALRPALGSVIVPCMTHIGAPGKSYHAGASLPMRERPGDWETDRQGTPTGFHRVHLVDAACFSSVPATNITLTIMANAYRIADQVMAS